MSKIHQALKKAEKEKKPDPVIHQDKLPNEKKYHFEDFYSKDSSINQHLVALSKPKSSAAEQYRKLRTTILQTSDSNPNKCILVTSSVLGEGKTITAVNLAVSIALGVDEHVLLIDADLRRPYLHNYFGLKPAAGLSTYLTKEIELSDLLIKTSVPKLTFLPSGPVSDKPSELFYADKMRSLIKEVRSRYTDRYIIIDSTPMMSTSESDILSGQVDGILFVVRSGKVPRKVIKRSILNLEKKNIIGVVFNDIKYNPAGYYYSYYKYYGKE